MLHILCLADIALAAAISYCYGASHWYAAWSTILHACLSDLTVPALDIHEVFAHKSQYVLHGVVSI